MQRKQCIPAALALGLLLATGAAAQGIPRTAAEAALPEELRFPVVDPIAQPSQVAFGDWPTPEMLDRAYWLPWSEMSLRRAALFGRPALLVMTNGWSGSARETIEGALADPAVLRTVNQSYVGIVVNADRRPDLKERYQTGTWPVIAWLLPNGNPMLSQANDLGVAQPITAGSVTVQELLFLLVEGQKYWVKWPDLLLRVGADWADREGKDKATSNRGPVDEVATDGVEAWLLGNADRAGGGFGAAPKFLVSGLHEYAWIRAARLRPALKQHSRHTLNQMLASPLYDGQGGGLYRIATLPGWQGVQHEKMLAGNAALLRELHFALRDGATPELADAALKTATFLRTTLAREGGGFYLAQSAPPATGPNSLGEGDGNAPVDPQVIAGPNALAGAALVRTGSWLGDETIIADGTAALDLVLRQGLQAGRGTRHVIEPNPNPRIFLTAQADVAFGMIDAYEALGDKQYLDAAQAVVDFAALNLGNAETGLVDYLAEPDALGLLANPRRPLVPNVRLGRAALRLAIHGAGDNYRELARHLLGVHTADLTPFAIHGTEAALGIEEFIREPLTIRIDGDPTSRGTRDLRREALRSPWPWTVVTTGSPSGKARATLQRGAETVDVTVADAMRDAILGMFGGTAP